MVSFSDTSTSSVDSCLIICAYFDNQRIGEQNMKLEYLLLIFTRLCYYFDLQDLILI